MKTFEVYPKHFDEEKNLLLLNEEFSLKLELNLVSVTDRIFLMIRWLMH
jgi:hypothetical protein